MKPEPTTNAKIPGAAKASRGVRDFPGAEDAEDTSLKRPQGETDLRAPHERDEAPDPYDDSEGTPATGPRQVIEQAARDIERGLKDTSRAGTATTSNDGPATAAGSQGVDPLGNSPGADVPAEGIDRASSAPRGSRPTSQTRGGSGSE